MRNIKVAIIGCGRMGFRYIAVCRELGLELAGCFDQNVERMEIMQKEVKGNFKIFRSIDLLLDNLKPEVVIVATTSIARYEYITVCAQASVRYLLAEKPLCISLKQAGVIASLEKETGIKIAVNHQMRFMEQYTTVKTLLNSEAFGGIQGISVQAGNFGIAMNGSHYFEMFRYMTDEYPKKVWAWLSKDIYPNPRGIEFEDQTGCVRVSSATGKNFYLDASKEHGHGLMVTYVARFGQVVVDELSGFLYKTYRKDPGDRSLPTTRYGQPSIIETQKIAPVDMIHSTAQVLNALLNSEHYPNIQDATMVVRTLVGAYISHEKDHMGIDLEDDLLPELREFRWA